MSYDNFMTCLTTCLTTMFVNRAPELHMTPLSGEWGHIATFHCPMQCFNASSKANPWRLHYFVRHLVWYPPVSFLEVC